MGKKKTTSSAMDVATYPVITFDDAVVLPMVPQPVKIEDESKIHFIDKAFEGHNEVLVLYEPKEKQKGSLISTFNIGAVCRVDKVLRMPGAPSLVFLMPIFRAECMRMFKECDITYAKVLPLPSPSLPQRLSKENKSMIEHLDKLFEDLTSVLGEPERQNAYSLVNDFATDSLTRIYAMAHVAPLTLDERLQILECGTFRQLLSTILVIFDEADQRMQLQLAIQEKTHRELSRQQKEAFLRLHLKNIQDELGDSSDEEDIRELLEKADKVKWSPEERQHFDRELTKLRRLNYNNPEYSVLHSYLETLVSLPWKNYAETDISLQEVEKILDRDHFGLEKVKDRIIEQMAVLKLRNDLKAPIICLFGPPGIGKTSIGKSVAEALGREYVRIALGGVHDEAEIRGHRRTYIGAMPGRFIHALTKIKTGNPLVLLDEIDKVGKDYKGDPSSALLEALDPEQNNTFHDNFIDYPYDLSKILFIATANDLSTIPAPLRDRMEIIEMTGYIPAEKREIALRHLVAKALADNGFKEKEIGFTPEAIDLIIRYYTREAGVRQLEKKIGKILRKIARLKASKKRFPKVITPELAEQFLGKREYNPDSSEVFDTPGVATGLAWTPVGGDILFIETSLSPGKGEKITLTGNLGDVMKESAIIALQYLKANAASLGIDFERFSKNDIHIHVPEGAVPKDGPSAGITIASSMASAFLNRKLPDNVAMTGEITLRGKVLPVGGIKEKIIAARQGGVKTIILSEENRKDIEEIPSEYIEGLEFIYVKTVSEVLTKLFP